jgi:galactokinase/mevalonate kinase-like predicted kinase
MLENLHYQEIGLRNEVLLEGDLTGFGELMNDHWQHKKKRASQMSNPDIDRWYDPPPERCRWRQAGRGGVVASNVLCGR